MTFLVNFGQMAVSLKRRPWNEVDMLQTFSLFVQVEVDINSFKSNVRNISRIIDSNRLVEKRQGVLTDYFSKK